MLPTATLPKETLAGLAPSVELDATPIPDIVRVWGEFGALSVKLMLPDAAPAALGANFAVKDVPCPAARVIGVARPLMLKPVPETFACEIEMLAEPELVSVTDEVPFAPTITLPKPTVNGLAVRLPWVPEPVRGIESVALLAVLETVMLPEAAPAMVGVN